MSPQDELRRASEALAEAAAEGRWSDAAREARRRADALEEVATADPAALEAALPAGENALAAVRKLRADLEGELANLRAARRSAGALRPYREASGRLLDVSS